MLFTFFVKDKEMDYHKEDPDIKWTKENGGREKPFDFDAFLEGTEEYPLDDQVTRLLGGKDLLEPDAFGDSVSEYVPSRRGDGERGRHEVPEPESTAREGDWEEDEEPLPEEEEPEPEPEEESAPEPRRFDPSDPRYAAPERPHIVVAEPRGKVIIEPDTAEDLDGGKKERGVSEALKWVIAVLVAIAIIGGVVIKFVGNPADIRNMIASILPIGETAENRPKETKSAAPTPSPTPAQATATPVQEVTPAPAVSTHKITVTADPGGTISPSGVVEVRDGESVTFSIIPGDGYSLSQLVVDGSAVEMGGTYTFHDVTRDHTIYAAFLQDEPAPAEETPPMITPEPLPEDTPEPVTPEPVTPEPVTPEPITPEPITPEPITPEPITPEPVTPEPITPEPLPEPPETEEFEEG